jgi:hypothetical protein
VQPLDDSQPFLHPAKRKIERNNNHPGAKTTTNNCVNTTNKRQNKLPGSKIIASKTLAIYPGYRARQNQNRYSITSTCDTIPGIEFASKRENMRASYIFCWR